MRGVLRGKPNWRGSKLMNKPTKNELFDSAIAAGKAGNNRQAIALWREYVQIEPSSAIGYNNLGHILSEEGQLRAAITALSKAVSLDPHYARAYSNLGTVLSDSGNRTESVEAYRRAVELEGSAVQHYNLANALDRTGETKSAIEHYREALRLSQDLSEAHFNLAKALTAVGDFAGSVEHLSTYVVLCPTDIDAKRKLAGALDLGGWLAEAEDICRSIVQERPNDPETMMIMAIIRQDMAKHSRSVPDAESALQSAIAAFSCNRSLPYAWRMVVYAYVYLLTARRRARGRRRS